MSIRLTSHRTVLGKASASILSLGEQLVRGTNSTDTFSSDSAAVSGINLVKQETDYSTSHSSFHCTEDDDGEADEEEGEGSKHSEGKEQFIVIGSDSSIARQVHPHFLSLFLGFFICFFLCLFLCFFVCLFLSFLISFFLSIYLSIFLSYNSFLSPTILNLFCMIYFILTLLVTS